MTCSQCGAYNSDEALFCQRCGKRLEIISQDASTLPSPTSPSLGDRTEIDSRQDATLPSTPYKSSPYTSYGTSEPSYPPPPPSPSYGSTSTPYEPKPPLRPHSTRRYLIAITVLVIILLSAGFFELGQLLKGSSQGNTNLATPTAVPPSTPSQSVIYHSVVNANQDFPGLDTGIDLTVGSNLTIKASGAAAFGTGSTQNCSTTEVTNPDGQRITANGTLCSEKIDSAAALSSAPIGELLANIGQPGSSSSTGWFAIGSSYSDTISTGGQLYLLYNDDPGYYGDNSGNYQVTITLTIP